jgi:hypothetical protein
MRSCVDCRGSVGIKATRCPPCQRSHRTAYERERLLARRDEQLADRPDFGVDEIDGGVVVDYTGPSAKPPDFAGVARRSPEAGREPGLVDYSKAQHRPSIFERRSRTPLTTRAEPEDLSWDEALKVKAERDARTVDFSTPCPGSAILQPQGLGSGYERNAIGQSIPRERPWR